MTIFLHYFKMSKEKEPNLTLGLNILTFYIMFLKRILHVSIKI